MDKEELKRRIISLPEFEMRDVKVMGPIPDEGKQMAPWVLQPKKAICKTDGDLAYAYVSPSYKLVQFKDVFLPVVNGIEDDAACSIADFGGYASIKVFPNTEACRAGIDRFGLICCNSVDMSSSIIVKFIVQHGDDWSFTIPPTVAGLKKQHSGDVKNIVKDYVSMVGKVQAAWGHIINEFPKYRIVREIKADEEGKVLEIGMVADRLKLGKRLTAKIIEAYEKETLDNKTFTLWDFLILVLEQVSGSKYKSEVHKDGRINKVSEAVFGFAFTLSV